MFIGHTSWHISHPQTRPVPATICSSTWVRSPFLCDKNEAHEFLLKHIFVPAYEGDYEEDDEKIRFFIQNHIDRFELNGRRFTSSVVDICVKIVTWYNNGTIEYDALMENLSMESFSNVLGALFWEYLQLEFDKQSVKKMVDFCELLVILDAVP